jgi:hypothetical protein
VFYPLGGCKRRCCWKRKKTQHEINNLFSAPEFNIATRISQLLNIIFTCTLYSAGMPGLNIVAFFAIILIYWTDKFLILNHFRKPPLYSSSLNNRAMNVLPFAVFLHCLFAFYMFGSDHIFPLGFEEEDGIVIGETQYSYDRLIRPSSGIPYVLLFLLTGAIYVFNYALTGIFDKMVKNRNRKISAVDAQQKNFAEMEHEIREHGLASYSIMANHKYRPLIQALNSAASKIKELRLQQEKDDSTDNLFIAANKPGSSGDETPQAD